jgi:hypothetical protein
VEKKTIPRNGKIICINPRDLSKYTPHAVGLFLAGKFIGANENNVSTCLRAVALQHAEACLRAVALQHAEACLRAIAGTSACEGMLTFCECWLRDGKKSEIARRKFIHQRFIDHAVYEILLI